MVHIESQMVPLVIQLENEGEDRYALVGYTSQTEIPQEYVREYAVVQCSLEKILLDMKAVGILLGKTPVLAINLFTEKEKVLTLDQILDIMHSEERDECVGKILEDISESE